MDSIGKEGYLDQSLWKVALFIYNLLLQHFNMDSKIYFVGPEAFISVGIEVHFLLFLFERAFVLRAVVGLQGLV